MLEFRNVDVNIGKTPILKDISLQLEKGKITALIGSNGCGKTTLLQTLNGVSTVVSGDIILDDEFYLKLPARERARRLSFMPQFRESAPCISVKGLVEHGRFPYMGFARKMNKEDEEAIEQALEFTGISKYGNCMVNELSGGLQQRAYLAMQLAQKSPYMVMDEPMNYLDFPGQREMLGLIRKLRDTGYTVILVLHDLNQALQTADRLIVMKDRGIVDIGTPQECLQRGTIEKVFDCTVTTIESGGIPYYMFI